MPRIAHKPNVSFPIGFIGVGGWLDHWGIRQLAKPGFGLAELGKKLGLDQMCVICDIYCDILMVLRHIVVYLIMYIEEHCLKFHDCVVSMTF